MTFVLKPLQFEDLNQIYQTDGEAVSTICHKRGDWPSDMHGLNWVINEDDGNFLLKLPQTREDVSNRYLFGGMGGVVIMRELQYCEFKILYASPMLKDRMETVADEVRRAFKVAGELVDGTTDEASSFAVPFAKLRS